MIVGSTALYLVLALVLLCVLKGFWEHHLDRMIKQSLIDEAGHRQFSVIYILHGVFLELAILLKLGSLILLMVGKDEKSFSLMMIFHNCSSTFLYLTYSMDWLKFTAVRMHM